MRKSKMLLYCSICLALTGLDALAEVLVVNDGELIQDAVRKAVPGDVIRILPGLYKETVYIDKDDITLSGVISNRERPVLDGEEKLYDGILAAGHGVVIENLHVKRFLGNGIMTQGANNFVIRNNIVEGPGIYAIFPQFGKNGLISHNTVTYTDDAAIYIGMSENIDVLYNEVYGAIMGIETENSSNVLVEGNYLHDNTIGFVNALVHGLPVKTSSTVIVRNNIIVDNNLDNFVPETQALSFFPSGNGIYVFGADETIIEDNLIKNNVTSGISVFDAGRHRGAVLDPGMDPSPNNTRILGNRFIGNGTAPKDSIGNLLKSAGQTTGPDVLSDGKGRSNCLANREELMELGTGGWKSCSADFTSAHIKTMRLPKPVESPALTLEQKGRFTYLAVCTACHSYNATIVGPPVLYMQAVYQNNPEGLVEFIKNPVKRNPMYPSMPPQNYMPDEVLLETAKYILQLEP